MSSQPLVRTTWDMRGVDGGSRTFNQAPAWMADPALSTRLRRGWRIPHCEGAADN
ncbi:hypothetical protein [Corynebacterium auriscanis]|uniref:hypothetical protein n=1 Tax=Corynebacterium auriscanis TaxID=99807 RepID=UPI003CF0FDA1